MPEQVVDIDLRSQTGATAQRTYSDLVLVGTDPTIADPTVNEPQAYDSASEVANDFGSDSDVHVASQAVEARGVRQWWVVMLDTPTHSETLGDSDTTSTDEGTVANAPIRGGLDNITVSLDGTDQTVVPVTESPPNKPDAGEAAVNFDTGEVKTGETTSGAGSGIQVDYETTSFDTARPQLDSHDFDLTTMADVRADRSYIGELDDFVQYCESEKVSLVLAYANGDDYASDSDAMSAAHDIGGYAPSGRVLPVAHKSNDAVASAIAGRMATKRAWFNPYFDGGADYSFDLNEYRRALIGSPGSPGTFEGGDADETGPANVLHTQNGVQVLSNSLSTAGPASDFQYFDVSRTQSFIAAESERALLSLQMQSERIPFAKIGRTMIQSALQRRLNQYVSPEGRALSAAELRRLRSSDNDEEEIQAQRGTGRANVPLSELEIEVPRYDELPSEDRANRVWSGITINARLSGHAHTFSIELVAQV